MTKLEKIYEKVADLLYGNPYKEATQNNSKEDYSSQPVELESVFPTAEIYQAIRKQISCSSNR